MTTASQTLTINGGAQLWETDYSYGRRFTACWSVWGRRVCCDIYLTASSGAILFNTVHLL